MAATVKLKINPWSIWIKGVLIGALGAPAIGLALFLVAPTIVGQESSRMSARPSDLFVTLFLWWPFLYAVTAVSFGPLGAIVSAGGIWLLRTFKARGAGPGMILAAGAIVGSLFGACILPLCFDVIGPILHGKPPALGEVMPFPREEAVIGGVTGFVLGIILGVLVLRDRRSAGPA